MKWLSLCIMLSALLLIGCGADTAMKKGDKYFALGEYFDAATQYKKGYAQTPAKERALRGQRALKMADCYRRINQTQRAMAAYNNAVRYRQADTTALFHLAQLQLKNGSYKDAEKTLLLLMDSLGTTEAKLKAEAARQAKASARNDVAPATARTLGPQVLVALQSARMAPQWKAEAQYSGYTVKKQELFNSRRAEYSPALAGDDSDQLYFSSTRNQANGDELSGITGMKNADIFFSQRDDKGKWSKPEPIESELNSDQDEGACTFSADFKTMYLTVCKTDPSYPRFAQVATAQRTDAAWGKATVLELSKDTLSTFAHPAPSPDGRWLYFVSDMPGGLGGYDLWRAELSGSNILSMENLGAPINTPGNEMFPTFRPNGDLYFSSDGHPGFGGLDIYYVESEEFFAKQSGKAERRVKSEEFAAATPSADGIPVGNTSFFTLHSSLSMALDLCAAPGGKSTLLRALLPDEALLYSNEPVRQRASILSENIQKWGHRGSIVTNNYPQDYVRSGLMFDLILCDVPCSGEGMFRRDPQTIGEWSPQQVEKCWRLQRDIVSQAWQCLRPGGLLIYSTCTFNIKENEENVRWMMEQLEADIVSVPTLPEWNITGSLLEGFNAPVYRFIPGITRSEGLFVAVMRKKGDGLKVESGRRKLSSLHPSPSTRHLSPSLLRVLFDGRQPCEEAVATAELTYAEAISYLRGEALRLAPDVPRGIVDVCFMGQRLGQVKNIGSRANNLYPKEWRIRSTHGPADYQPIVG